MHQAAIHPQPVRGQRDGQLIQNAPPKWRPLLRLAHLLRNAPSQQVETHVQGVKFALGNISGRDVAAYAFDPSIKAGALDYEMGCAIADFVRKYALRGYVIVGINESSGANVKGISSLHGYGKVFRAHVDAQGKTLQLSAILGVCCGGAVYAPALTDLIFARADSYYSLTGRKVASMATGGQVEETLGQCRKRKIFYRVSPTDEDVLDEIRKHIQSGVLIEKRSSRDSWRPKFAERLCNDPVSRELDLHLYEEWTARSTCSFSFDVRRLVSKIFDQNGLKYEFMSDTAPELFCAYTSLLGKPIALVANNSLFNAGVISASAASKGATFIASANAAGIPIITFVDTPGFLPTYSQEVNEIERKGAALYAAYALANVPKITVVIGKGFGGAWVAMGSETTGAYCCAWPKAKIAVMGDKLAATVTKGTAPVQSDCLAEGLRIGAIQEIIENPLATRAKLSTILQRMN